MATKYLRLGFKSLRNNQISNIYSNNKKIGYSFEFYLNFYRGLHLSNIENVEIYINDYQINEYSIRINEKQFKAEELKALFAEFWSIKTPLIVEVVDGKGLKQGKYKVDVVLHIRCPYMQFGPNRYASIDSSDHEIMEVKN